MNPTPQHVTAAALAALGATCAIPIPLAQLDFAGVFNVFNIDSGDAPQALRVIAGIGAVLTLAVLALAFVGVALVLSGSPLARNVLIVAAVTGFATFGSRRESFWEPPRLCWGRAQSADASVRGVGSDG
jgi:hypothetical protein